MSLSIIRSAQKLQNDQNSFHSTIDTPPDVPGVSKNPVNQTEVYSGELER